jgi:hypothetical protein
MKATLTASTGEKILVWREDQMLHARRASTAGDPQICLAIDLFEVIAELAGLDLEHEGQAAEALKLAEEAQRRLSRPQPYDQGDAERSRNEGWDQG